MLLVLDVSNRQTAVALFDADRSGPWWISTDPNRTADEVGLLLETLLRHRGVDATRLRGAVLGSVVPALTRTVSQACARYLGLEPLVVGPGVRTGVRVRTDNPREVGPDRIANALAAFRRYGGPAVVVDFSSTTTFDAVSAEGDYLGSAIAPGLDMASGALAQRAAQLREVELLRPERVIGRNTVAAIQSGLVYGFAALVDGIAERMKSELGGGRVIATGPDVGPVQSEARSIDVVDPMLTLDGLRLIWELNAGEGSSR